ncbi:MAG TPA: DUF5908 family protein [Pseudomonadota bacterium]|nr:DUF5908 family protein [Pseudomonadota bacterium]
MPVEIRELVIRAVAQSEGTRTPLTSGNRTPGEADQAIVEAAVREVLRILKTARER